MRNERESDEGEKTRIVRGKWEGGGMRGRGTRGRDESGRKRGRGMRVGEREGERQKGEAEVNFLRRKGWRGGEGRRKGIAVCKDQR